MAGGLGLDLRRGSSRPVLTAEPVFGAIGENAGPDGENGCPDTANARTLCAPLIENDFA